MTLGLFVAQLHFRKVAAALFNRQLGHPGACLLRLVLGNRTVHRIGYLGRLTALGQVAAVQVPHHGLGRLEALGNRANGHPGARLQITAGKHALAAHGIGHRIGLGRAPARKFQTGHILDGCKVRTLADGRDQLVNFDLVLAARNRNRTATP